MGLQKNKKTAERSRRFGAIEAIHAECERLAPEHDFMGVPVEYVPPTSEVVRTWVEELLNDESAELDLESALNGVTRLDELKPTFMRTAGGYVEEDGEWHPPDWFVDLATEAAAARHGYAEALDALPEEMQDWLLYRCEDAGPLRAVIAEELRADPETEEMEIPQIVRDLEPRSRRPSFRPRHA